MEENETEKSLRAMMDVDDGEDLPVTILLLAPALLTPFFLDQVIRVSRNATDSSAASPAPASPSLGDDDEDVDMAPAAPTVEDDDLKVKAPPRKRKPKKVLPVGRNGLKKRRVEKSRTSFDAKGYMSTCFFCASLSAGFCDSVLRFSFRINGRS
jgi:DNA polymerase delta subunit 3